MIKSTLIKNEYIIKDRWIWFKIRLKITVLKILGRF